MTLLITLMSGYFNRDDYLEKYLENYNEDFEQKDNLKNEFDAVANFILRCDFDSKCRVWKKADLFSLFVEVNRAIYKRKLDLKPEKIKKYLKDFYEKIENIPDPNDTSSYEGIYYKAALQATNDRGNRIKRGEIIQWVLDETYIPQIKIEQDSSADGA